MTECPCRYCTPPKRTEDCHATCKEYVDWRLEKDVEVQKKYQDKSADAFLAEKTRERKRIHYRRGGKH